MKHLGDISKINGAEIEPVDVITFGSPCQDLSVAGKRAGLKHEANGDEETTRSGLFMEAVRSGKVQTLTSRMGTGGGNVPLIMELKPIYCLQGNGIDRADTAGCNGKGWTEDVCYTLNTIDRPAVVMTLLGDPVAGTLKARDYKGVGRQDSLGSAVCICFDKEVYNSGVNGTGGHYIAEDGPAPTLRAGVPPGVNVEYIVRRLTPTECARLQGFPDRWGDIEPKEDFTEEEYQFWLDVRNTHAAINGKQVKDYTKKQMLTWYMIEINTISRTPTTAWSSMSPA